MDFEYAREYADKAFLNARAMLELEGFLDPVILAMGEDSVTPVSIKIEKDEDTEMVAQLLAELATHSEAIILIMDSYYREVHKDKVDTVPEDLTQDENASDALTCALFMKGKTSLRIASYLNKNGRYTFMDHNWKECENDKGLFKNPFEKK